MSAMHYFAKAATIFAGLGTSGCVMVIPVPATESPRFSGCAQSALTDIAGPGTPEVIGSNEVRHNGWRAWQHANGTVEVYTSTGTQAQIDAVLANTVRCVTGP